jgi:hypothetical protein
MRQSALINSLATRINNAQLGEVSFQALQATRPVRSNTANRNPKFRGDHVVPRPGIPQKEQGQEPLAAVVNPLQRLVDKRGMLPLDNHCVSREIRIDRVGAIPKERFVLPFFDTPTLATGGRDQPGRKAVRLLERLEPPENDREHILDDIGGILLAEPGFEGNGIDKPRVPLDQQVPRLLISGKAGRQHAGVSVMLGPLLELPHR